MHNATIASALTELRRKCRGRGVNSPWRLNSNGPNRPSPRYSDDPDKQPDQMRCLLPAGSKAVHENETTLKQTEPVTLLAQARFQASPPGVRANVERLTSCADHVFELCPITPDGLRMRFEGTHRGGGVRDFGNERKALSPDTTPHRPGSGRIGGGLVCGARRRLDHLCRSAVGDLGA